MLSWNADVEVADASIQFARDNVSDKTIEFSLIDCALESRSRTANQNR